MGSEKGLTCAVDYVEIISEDPRITTLHASKFQTMFLHNKLPEFDAIISYSSLEHSGLGRYRNILKLVFAFFTNLLTNHKKLRQ